MAWDDWGAMAERKRVLSPAAVAKTRNFSGLLWPKLCGNCKKRKKIIPRLQKSHRHHL